MYVYSFQCKGYSLKVRQSRNGFFKPTILPENKRANSVFVLWSNCFVRFLEEFEDTKSSFEINLCRSISKKKKKTIQNFYRKRLLIGGNFLTGISIFQDSRFLLHYLNVQEAVQVYFSHLPTYLLDRGHFFHTSPTQCLFF